MAAEQKSEDVTKLNPPQKDESKKDKSWADISSDEEDYREDAQPPAAPLPAPVVPQEELPQEPAETTSPGGTRYRRRGRQGPNSSFPHRGGYSSHQEYERKPIIWDKDNFIKLLDKNEAPYVVKMINSPNNMKAKEIADNYGIKEDDFEMREETMQNGKSKYLLRVNDREIAKKMFEEHKKKAEIVAGQRVRLLYDDPAEIKNYRGDRSYNRHRGSPRGSPRGYRNRGPPREVRESEELGKSEGGKFEYAMPLPFMRSGKSEGAAPGEIGKVESPKKEDPFGGLKPRDEFEFQRSKAQDEVVQKKDAPEEMAPLPPPAEKVEKAEKAEQLEPVEDQKEYSGSPYEGHRGYYSHRYSPRRGNYYGNYRGSKSNYSRGQGYYYNQQQNYEEGQEEPQIDLYYAEPDPRNRKMMYIKKEKKPGEESPPPKRDTQKKTPITKKEEEAKVKKDTEDRRANRFAAFSK